LVTAKYVIELRYSRIPANSSGPKKLRFMYLSLQSDLIVYSMIIILLSFMGK